MIFLASSKGVGFFALINEVRPSCCNAISISSILSLVHGIVPPTINHETVDENIDPELNLTLNKAQKRNSKVAMSNTFGFGGHNACVLFKKLDE